MNLNHPSSIPPIFQLATQTKQKLWFKDLCLFSSIISLLCVFHNLAFKIPASFVVFISSLAISHFKHGSTTKPSSRFP